MIRKMTIADYNDVYSLWISTKGMGLNSMDDSRDGMDTFLKRNPNTCFVALEGERLVGVVLTGHDGRRGHIYHTAVAEEYRCQGIGRALVKQSMEALSDEGITKVMLVVFEKNKMGNDFWEKIGFTKRDDLVYRNKTLVEFERIDT